MVFCQKESLITLDEPSVRGVCLNGDTGRDYLCGMKK